MNGSAKEGKAADNQDHQIGLICLCPEGFESVWMPRHQVMTRLSKTFWTVWLEPANGWREIARNFSRPKSSQVQKFGKFIRYFPGFLPLIYRPRWLGRLFDAIRLRLAARVLRKQGCKRIYLYIWRPEFANYASLMKFDRCIYHIDDEYTFSDDDTETPSTEKRLIECADHVIIHSHALIDKKGAINPATSWVPNGVDYESFSSPQPEPADLQSVPRPRAGYLGVIKKQLDLALLKSLAESMPKVSFVLVGPRGMLGSDEKILNEMVGMPNVFELGAKEPSRLGSYMQHMDVLLMAYKNDDYTKFIYPLKLHEYLATGRPVVSTPIRTVLDFADIVRLAETTEEWTDGIDDAIAEGSRNQEAIRERQRTAKEFDWNSLVSQIEKIILEL